MQTFQTNAGDLLEHSRDPEFGARLHSRATILGLFLDADQDEQSPPYVINNVVESQEMEGGVVVSCAIPMHSDNYREARVLLMPGQPVMLARMDRDA